mgnify:CR=1 FL=1
MSEIKPYRAYQPSNGTEGMMFRDRFCDRCRCDSEKSPCPIYGATLVYDPGDHQYPNQYWVEDEDGSNPRCTLFFPKRDE